MEAAELGDLAGLIKQTVQEGAQLGEAAAWQAVMQISDALSFMHERRVMYRDIKPASLGLSRSHPHPT